LVFERNIASMRTRATAALDAAFCPVIHPMRKCMGDRRRSHTGAIMFAPETAVRLGRAARGLCEMRRDVRAARAFAPYLGYRAKYPKVQSLIGAEYGQPESA
jgi:hypothetical protein